MKMRAIIGVAVAFLGVAIPLALVLLVSSPGEQVSTSGPESKQHLLLSVIGLVIGFACGLAGGALMRSSASSLTQFTLDTAERLRRLHA